MGHCHAQKQAWLASTGAASLVAQVFVAVPMSAAADRISIDSGQQFPPGRGLDADDATGQSGLATHILATR